MHESLSGVQRYAAAANYMDASPVAGLAEWQRTPMVMLLLLLFFEFYRIGRDGRHTTHSKSSVQRPRCWWHPMTGVAVAALISVIPGLFHRTAPK